MKAKEKIRSNMVVKGRKAGKGNVRAKIESKSK